MQTPSQPSGFASPADSSACRKSLRGGSHTFFAASLILPGRVRRPAAALYAFCRAADDAIDQGVDRDAALLDLMVRLDRIYDREPANIAADRAFADCVSRHAIPKRLPLALLEGFAWDAAGRRYESLAELRGYAVRVAGTVGVMMAMVMGVRDQRTLARACDLGVAMQLTNIARDVGEDARAGRVYLPLAWLRQAGIDAEEFLAAPSFNRELAGVVERLLTAADVLYAQSEPGIGQLPASCRPAMFAARLLYAEIGNELRRRGGDSVNARAIVPARRKARLLAAAGFAAQRRPGAPKAYRALAEADFLLRFFPNNARDPSTAARGQEQNGDRRRGIAARVIWLIDLFERLERSER